MVNMENYEEYLLLYADGELGEAEQKELLDFINQHPELKAEMDIYATVKLVPDEAIVYNNKEQLLKKVPSKKTISMRSWWIYVGAAACIVLFISIGFNNTEQQLAITKSKSASEETNIAKPASEKFHSIPVKPVAMETIQEPVKPVQVAKAKPRVNKTNPAKTDEPLIAKENVPEQEYTNQQPLNQKQHVENPSITPDNHRETIAVAEAEAINIILPHAEGYGNDRKGLLAVIPVKENLQGLNELSKNFGSQIEKLKEIPEKIRDTDVHFRIGKKELFVVKL